MKIIHEILDILSLNNTIALSTDYVNTPDHCDDFRDVIHPKPSRRKFNDPFVAKPYHQTFAERFPFAPNLSVMDLLFNEGPDTTLYL